MLLVIPFWGKDRKTPSILPQFGVTVICHFPPVLLLSISSMFLVPKDLVSEPHGGHQVLNTFHSLNSINYRYFCGTWNVLEKDQFFDLVLKLLLNCNFFANFDQRSFRKTWKISAKIFFLFYWRKTSEK